MPPEPAYCTGIASPHNSMLDLSTSVNTYVDQTTMGGYPMLGNYEQAQKQDEPHNLPHPRHKLRDNQASTSPRNMPPPATTWGGRGGGLPVPQVPVTQVPVTQVVPT